MATQIYSIRFERDLMARVDGLSVGRSEFIRNAVEAALARGPAAPAPVCADVADPVAPAVVPEKKNSNVPVRASSSDRAAVSRSGRQADAAAVLALVRSGRFTSRQAEASMGWLGLRYGNAEKLLLSSGAVAIVDGHLVAT